MSRTARRVASPRPVNGAARRTTVLSSSTVQSCIATMATTCWASTSSGLAGTRSSSIAPTRIRPAVTAEGTRSPRWVGKITPRETAPTWWPARPTRCRPEATDGGAPTWTTRSTAPMSMPSSRDDVATTAGRWPDLSSVSVRVRSARLIDPWWARARMPLASRVSMPTAVPDCAVTWAAHSVPGSGTPAPWRAAHTSFIRAVSRSAPRRELVKTSVDLVAAHRSTLVFTHSRRGAERLTARMNEVWAARQGAGVPDPGTLWAAQVTAQSGTAVGIDTRDASGILARAHHGSMSRAERTRTETELKSGHLPAVVATSSLELGIDPRDASGILARAHHGSMSRAERTRTETELKSGHLPAVVATSSLELGIDMGAVDLDHQVDG